VPKFAVINAAFASNGTKGATQEAQFVVIDAFCCLAFSINPVKSRRWLVRAVGIEPKATLKIRKLLILLNAKNAKNTEFAQPRCTRGTHDISA